MTARRTLAGPWQVKPSAPHKVVDADGYHVCSCGFGPSEQSRALAAAIAEFPGLVDDLRWAVGLLSLTASARYIHAPRLAEINAKLARIAAASAPCGTCERPGCKAECLG